MLLALKVSPFFISSVQPPQWADMKGTAECYKDGVVFAICVNLTCFSVFTERSVPKLWGPTLSEMNNLFIITLNLLSCYNCLSNILPDFFSCADMTRIKVMLACLFHSGKKKLFNDFDLQWVWRGGLQSFRLWSPNVFSSICRLSMTLMAHI